MQTTEIESLQQVVSSTFEARLGYTAQYLIQAPGRVNLIGEHTDYNDGFVLPCAINYQTMVAASPRKDNIVRLISVDYDNEQDQFDLTEEIEFIENKMWANYIRGVVKCLLDHGYQFTGADIVVSGNVPQGAGLSSSAALEVVIGQTFKTLYDLKITQQEIALNGQKAENEFVGCNCGIMDQLISACGQDNHALLIDCRSLDTAPISMPGDMVIMIINSNKKRGLVGSEYNTRREQCESASQHFSVKALRDLSIEQLEAGKDKLDPVVYRRARHVITENARTLLAADALQSGDLRLIAKLMSESHISMRDDFEITVPEIDHLVDVVKKQLGDEGGVRMTGGGFGGCIVALMTPQKVQAVKRAVEAEYQNTLWFKRKYLCLPSKTRCKHSDTVIVVGC